MTGTFVGEDKSKIVLFDILCSELIKSTFSENCEVIIVSTWVKDYPIPTTWPSFSSNYIEIKDMQKISDVLRKLLDNGISITILTKSEKTLRSEGWGDVNTTQAIEFHQKLKESGAAVCYTAKNHGKYVITSENVFISSANETNTGMGGEQGNAGTLHSRSKNEDLYNESLKWCLDWIKKSENPDEYFMKNHYFSK